MSSTHNITADVTARLIHMFEFFNQELHTNLDTPVFTLIPNRGRQSYYGWYWAGRWKCGKKALPEINITADQLKRPVEDIANTLIHEMAHYKNNVRGVVDCNANQYHNKHFKTCAESLGLTVEKLRNRGYAKTALGEQAADLVKKYKSVHLKDGKNPFDAYRVTEHSVTVVKSNKRFVAIDKGLAAQAESISGDSIKCIVEHLLRLHVNGQSVAEV